MRLLNGDGKFYFGLISNWIETVFLIKWNGFKKSLFSIEPWSDKQAHLSPGDQKRERVLQTDIGLKIQMFNWEINLGGCEIFNSFLSLSPLINCPAAEVRVKEQDSSALTLFQGSKAHILEQNEQMQTELSK